MQNDSTRSILLSIIFGLIGVMVLLVLFFYFDARLGKVEERVTHLPPKAYTPPDLKALAVAELPKELGPQRTTYVPAYSHIYFDKGRPLLLEVTLSIRNIDPSNSVHLRSVKYYDTEGELKKTYLDEWIRLGPLQTIEFLVERHDSEGGSGANFLVDWKSPSGVSAPWIEAVMVGINGAQAVSFARSGVVLPGKN